MPSYKHFYRPTLKAYLTCITYVENFHHFLERFHAGFVSLRYDPKKN